MKKDYAVFEFSDEDQKRCKKGLQEARNKLLRPEKKFIKNVFEENNHHSSQNYFLLLQRAAIM